MLNIFGSLGLFLLGMWLMTEGLKLAGGQALEHLLGRWTSSRRRGFITGMSVTALVQSSSAVTVAVIGFVNAGLISFYQSMWVVFGSNVGTTFTAWIVTFFGFTLKIDAFAFPLVGVGALLRLFAPQERGRALGMAVAGFGLLFLGIDFLKENFSSIAQQVDVQTLLHEAGNPVIAALLVGTVLTLLTQSSSAAIVIILTAVASGILSLEVAAAAVIGANVGTTTTAILAVVGATPNAKRLAAAHVVFNLLTAAVALAFLPIFWWLVTQLSDMTGLGQSPTVLLAVFHTCFNILGVLLIWPLEKPLSRYLLNRFVDPKDAINSSHLDANVASIPDLAVRAVNLELMELFHQVIQLLDPRKKNTDATLKKIETRIKKVNEFVATVLKSELAQSQSDLLAASLSAVHHLNYSCRAMQDILEQRKIIKMHFEQEPIILSAWKKDVADFLASSFTRGDSEEISQLETILQRYVALKHTLIQSAGSAQIDIGLTDAALTEASFTRRFVEQLIQVAEALKTLAERDSATTKAAEDSESEA